MRYSSQQGHFLFRPDLLVHLLAQSISDKLAKFGVVREARKDVFVLTHAVNEQAFRCLVEDESKCFE